MESIDFSTNVNALMERIRDQQSDIERIQREIEVMEVVGATRDDEVRVTVRGNGQVVAVDIDESAPIARTTPTSSASWSRRRSTTACAGSPRPAAPSSSR